MKKSNGPTNLQQSRICIQKFLPEHQHIQNHLNSLPEHHRTKLSAAFYTKKIWPQNSVTTVSFKEKDPSIRRTSRAQTDTSLKLDPLQEYFWKNPKISIPDAIKEIVKSRYNNLLNVQFNFLEELDSSSADIRISFNKDGGSWSLVGTDCKNAKGYTMNFGWFDVATVLHEFGHALGLVHEHQNNKDNPIKWNDQVVYRWAKETQGWDKETTQTNILDAYNSTQINGSNFDPNSIMLYFFPARLTTNDKGTHENLRLSKSDVVWLNKTYPAKISPSDYYMKVYNESIDESDDNNVTKSNNKSHIFLIILFAMIAIIIIIFFFRVIK